MPQIEIELVPRYCQFSNIRSTVTTSQWNKLRFLTYALANNKCEVCFESGKDQGFKHNVECHEIWLYDDKKKIQYLTGLIALCPTCHLIKHIGRASAMGRQGICFKHMAKVNDWNHKQIVEHMAHSYALQKARADIRYKLDLSILNDEPYNLKLKLNEERVYIESKYSSVKAPKKKAMNKRPKK